MEVIKIMKLVPYSIITMIALAAPLAFAQTEHTQWSHGGNGKSKAEALAAAEYWAKKQATSICRNRGGVARLSVVEQDVTASYDNKVFRAKVKFRVICAA